jgi:hypothetical protein
MAPSKSRTDPIQLPKSMVDLICSNKGGVGKSFVCRIIYHLYLLRQLPITPFDADTSTHDFSDIYNEIPESNILIFRSRMASRFLYSGNQCYGRKY